MSCESYFNNELATKFLSDPRVVTENAIKLTPDEMHAIYMDIFKPLDSFEMFYERLKAQEKEKKKEELDEEWTRKIHKNHIWDPGGLFSIISHVSLSIT